MTKNLKDEITPQKKYATRKEFLKTLGVVGASAAVLAACQDKPFLAGDDLPEAGITPGPGITGLTDDLGDPTTSYDDVVSYNNFYEFTTDKEGVVKLSQDFQS